MLYMGIQLIQIICQPSFVISTKFCMRKWQQDLPCYQFVFNLYFLLCFVIAIFSRFIACEHRAYHVHEKWNKT